ncbi:MAG: M18 family aminopeptidase [Ornithinimicrobium sp.]
MNPTDGWAAENGASDLCDYLDASPSPFHAVASSAAMLEAAGFTRVNEMDPTPTGGRFFATRGGSLIAWIDPPTLDGQADPARPFRLVATHTDSPTLRIKPRPDHLKAGWQMLGVEVYGGPLLHTWLDRDLGVSGRAVIRGEAGTITQPFIIGEPWLRISSLAIHQDRDVTREGLKLNPARHLVPHWGVGQQPGHFVDALAEYLDVRPSDVLAWEAMVHDLTPARVIGRDHDLIASARLDNLASAHAATAAMVAIAAVDGSDPSAALTPPIPAIVMFDHEEVGSTTSSGAQSTFLTGWTERIVGGRGGSREDYLRSMAGTLIASADMTHATHPNYAERHDALHQVAMNGGPVIKVNAQARYATDPPGHAAFVLACEQARVPFQTYLHRTDLPCGSTVGPMIAAATGARTVDVGAPTLSMHSSREVCGVSDRRAYQDALGAFLTPLTPP